MPYYVRLMRNEDIAQVSAIDREAFPTMWPPTNFHKELKNRLAHYIVACDEARTVDEREVKTSPEKGLARLASRVRLLFNHDRFSRETIPLANKHYVAGFAGFWVLADEAHIINIAVPKTLRRHGIGELLLISVIDMAAELNARNITLEVRISNTAAQSLYRKYGFVQIGLRCDYYTDNREDAVLMSTEDITSARFQAQLRKLKQAHSGRWGIPLYQVIH